MTAAASSIGVQCALAGLVGKRVAKANSTIGTSFVVDFTPLHRVPRWQSDRSARWFGGHFTAQNYMLFQGCDWRIRLRGREFDGSRLEHQQMDQLLADLSGRMLLRAQLAGPNGGVSLQFANSTALSIRPVDDGDWWIGTRDGTISLFP